jgi:hypothetical protein
MIINHFHPRCDHCHKKRDLLSKVQLFGKIWEICPACKRELGNRFLKRGAIIVEPVEKRKTARVGFRFKTQFLIDPENDERG